MHLNLGIIGNCQYNALIAPDGNVVWMCWPRFDSSSVFGSLLDQSSQAVGRFQIGPLDQSSGIQSYITNTNVLRTDFVSATGKFVVIDFAPRFYQYDRFYKPKILIRIVRPLEGSSMVKVTCRPSYDYGREKLKSENQSNHILFSGADQPIRLHTNASLQMIADGRPLILSDTLYFVLSWSTQIDHGLKDLCESYLEKTVSYWQRWIKHCHLPQKYQHPVIRSALALKLHQFEDTGAIIAAPTTSIPEARGTERTWDYRYCWLRDAYFTLLALRRLGQFEEMEGFVSYLRNIAELSPERLKPVYGIAGEANLEEKILTHLSGYRDHRPVRIGNQAHEHLQHDIYGEMIMSISPLFLDARFTLNEESKPKTLLTRLLRNIEMYAESTDAGLWEYRGIAQVHTFSLLMHWAGARQTAAIARACHYDELIALAESLERKCRKFIDDNCWNEKLGAFSQAVQSRDLDAALLLMVPLGFLNKNDARAFSHVQAIHKQLSIGKKLLRRYRHLDDFGTTDNAFTVCSFWLVEAWARLGEKVLATELFESLLTYANPLGLFSEDLDPDNLEQWGNYPQTYSHVGIINASFALCEHLE